MKSFIFSLRVIFYGLFLPIRIWQLSKDKLSSQEGIDSIKNLLDKDYIATSWLDWVIDAIILLLYPIGLFIVLMFTIFSKASFFSLLALLPMFFMTLIISFAREIGGSFMLLHLNVKRIRDILEEKV